MIRMTEIAKDFFTGQNKVSLSFVKLYISLLVQLTFYQS